MGRIAPQECHAFSTPRSDATAGAAHSLRMKVVAEGVETRAQRDFLAGLGCDFIQGHYLSEALPVDKFEQSILAAHFPDNIFAKRSKR